MILVTGGAGYIGSHTIVALNQAGYVPVILDNLSNSNPGVLDRLGSICGSKPVFIQGDIRDQSVLDNTFKRYKITAVIHFAGLKSVGESAEIPLEYYDNNVQGTLNVLAAMRRAGINNFIFSSSATVYGDPAEVPIKEDAPRSVTNPYGRTKLIVEDILNDLYQAESDWSIFRLRYFNPVGAHESGMIGEDPRGKPNNLMPFISQVAIGRRPILEVFGGDYPTIDGTGVRDYIHVMDLAEGHVAALNYSIKNKGLTTINLGTGQGYSVLQMIKAFEHGSGKNIPYRIVARRPGDVAKCWADPSYANKLLGWSATRGLDQMCQDAWHWQQQNPEGYK